MAKYEDIIIDQGTDVAIQLNLVNIGGSPKNLTGYSAAAQLRETFSTSDSNAVTFSSIVSDPATAGIVTLSLTNAQTAAMEAGRYYYDVEISYYDSDSNQVIERILEGQAKITPNVTRL